MNNWHDYPVIKDKVCDRCQKGPIHVMLTTGFQLYLKCEECGHDWSEHERRLAHQRRATGDDVS